MNPLKINLRTLFSVLLLTVTSTLSHAQTVTWTGASGGEWNTAGNWDLGIPGVGTNAVINNGTTANYNLPMTAASFGNLTNYGVVNVNAAGFNSGNIFLLRPGGGDKLFVNSGGAVNVTGNLGFCSNGVVSVAAGGSLTVSGTIIVGSGSTGGTGGANPSSFGLMTNAGGTISAAATSLNPGNGSVSTSALLVINGGTNNLGNVLIKRSNAGSSGYSTLGTEGIIINGGQVTMTNANVGGSAGNSFLTLFVGGGAVTNYGNVTINQGSSARGSRLLQTGGLVVVPDPGLVNPNPTVSGSLNVYAVLGGTNLVGGIFFGNTNGSAGTVNFTNSASIFVGSQGIGYNGVATLNAALNNGGLFGATADWTNAATLSLNGTSFTFQAADPAGGAHNITSTGPLKGIGALIKTGTGTLTLTATNSYSGNTIINAGTLALASDLSGSSGTLASGTISVAANGTFDVSALTSIGGFTLGSAKTIAGTGTVTGNFIAGNGANVTPAGSGAQGTLNFASGLTASNANFNFELTSDTTGVITPNDAVKITGDLTVNGINNMVVSPVGSLSIGTYKLIQYSGNLNGSLANFATVSGTLTNPPGEIDLIVSSVRPAASLVWRGDGAANAWDTGASSNWLNGLSYDRSYIADTNNFDDSSTNFVVNINGIVTPAPLATVLVNTTNNYIFTTSSSGDITGTTGLTKTNSGTLTILTANDYTGVTAINGGTIIVASLANGGLASPLGAAVNSPANLLLNNGTLEYIGGNKTIDRGLTLQAAGGALNVSNAAATLTLSGSLTGPGALTKNGNGQLTLTGGNTYTGPTLITAGSIRANPAGTIGTNVLTLNGGASSATFQFAGDSETLSSVLNIVGTNNYLANAGNETLGNLTGSGTVNLQGNSGNVLTFAGDMSAFTGTIYVDTLPNPRFYPSTGGTNFTINLGTGSAILNNRNAGVTIQMGALFGGPSTVLQGGSTTTADNRATTYVIGANNASSEFDGVISESTSIRKVSLVKSGSGTFTLSGICVYTSFTTVNAGVLALIGSGAIGNTTNIDIAAGAVLDVSGRSDSTLTLNSGQYLRGNGTVRGSVTTSSGSTIAPADTDGAIGQLTITNALTLQSGANLNFDLDATPGAITNDVITTTSATFAGTLNLNLIAGTFTAGQSFKLFHAASYAGSFDSIVPASPGAGLTWNTNNLAVNGTLSIVAITPPAFSSITPAGSDLNLSATGGAAGGAVTVLTSTNLALPLAQWTTLTTGNFDGAGSFTYTVTGALNSGTAQQFFILQTQ